MTDNDRKDLYRMLERFGCGIYQNENSENEDYLQKVLLEQRVRKNRQKQKDSEALYLEFRAKYDRYGVRRVPDYRISLIQPHQEVHRRIVRVVLLTGVQ